MNSSDRSFFPVNWSGREKIIPSNQRWTVFLESVSREIIEFYNQENHPYLVIPETIFRNIRLFDRISDATGYWVILKKGPAVRPDDALDKMYPDLSGLSFDALACFSEETGLAGALTHIEKVFKIKVITCSDRAYQGVYPDLSGPALISILDDHFNKQYKRVAIDYTLLPDDPEMLDQQIRSMIPAYDLLFTTGGTGIGPRDFTVDVVRSFITREIPGIMELIRVKYGMMKPNAALSRGIAGLAGDCLVYTLPGSLKAVKEYMQEILGTLDHLYYMQKGYDLH
jgi:molybdenum cofactor synthesis domain-containing protein